MKKHKKIKNIKKKIILPSHKANKKIADNKVKLNKSKLKSLSQINSIEDIYYISSMIALSDLDKYMVHLKTNLKKIKHVNMAESLIKLIKKYKEPLLFIKEMHEELIRKLNEDRDKLYSQISERRKKGEDTLIAELELMSLPFKIKLFESTTDKKDFYKIKKKIEKITKLLNIEKL